MEAEAGKLVPRSLGATRKRQTPLSPDGDEAPGVSSSQSPTPTISQELEISTCLDQGHIQHLDICNSGLENPGLDAEPPLHLLFWGRKL